VNKPDLELEKIRQKKMEELMRKIPGEEKTGWPNEPVPITDETFQETVQRYPLVVIDCWAPWCAPCLMIAPIIEEMAKDYTGKIVFGKLNTDEAQGIAMKYGIMSIPTLLIFKNGKLVDQSIGAMPRQMLEPKIMKYL